MEELKKFNSNLETDIEIQKTLYTDIEHKHHSSIRINNKLNEEVINKTKKISEFERYIFCKDKLINSLNLDLEKLIKKNILDQNRIKTLENEISNVNMLNVCIN